MKPLKGTRTEKNLLKAFAGESQARMRYTYYASTARKEGYVQISNIFTETADNEKEHAKRFFKFLAGDKEVNDTAIEITANFPVSFGSTKENLLASAAGENEEWDKMYPEFADIADEEGFPEIAAVFRNIADAEKRHETRFRKLADNIEKGTVFKKDKPVLWKCNNCGYVHEGEEAPVSCPACAHPQAHFEVFVETY
ncbi:MAG: rubrerythrin family protein [Epulopiscium sp.]|jgi:rubrerythrin|nr:rubrerythrin family protein [Candidatus Epulonipiscium sp.]